MHAVSWTNLFSLQICFVQKLIAYKHTQWHTHTNVKTYKNILLINLYYRLLLNKRLTFKSQPHQSGFSFWVGYYLQWAHYMGSISITRRPLTSIAEKIHFAKKYFGDCASLCMTHTVLKWLPTRHCRWLGKELWLHSPFKHVPKSFSFPKQKWEIYSCAGMMHAMWYLFNPFSWKYNLTNYIIADYC